MFTAEIAITTKIQAKKIRNIQVFIDQPPFVHNIISNMKSQNKKVITKLPDSPGVYIFKHGSKILYIGKATSLRDRVRSYFNPDIITTRSPLISKMLTQFDTIEDIKTDSVLEALVLEAHLIKKYQPEANIKEKDNRSFNFVVITKEDFPRVLIMRGRELLQVCTKKSHTNLPIITSKNIYDISYIFGPFPSGGQLKEAMKIVRKMFPYRDKCLPNSIKPCFNRQIGLCPGVCTGEITKTEYKKQIGNIILFFEGNKKKLMKNLEKQMNSFSENKEFEKANIIKRTLLSLKHIQDISLIKESNIEQTGGNIFRIESYDIAHLSGTNVVGVMTVVEEGEVKKSDYRKFKIKDDPGINDTRALEEVLSRRLAHIEWRSPDLIVVDGGVAQKRRMEKILKENHQNIPIVSVVKNEYHRPREILGDKKWLVYEREIILSNSEAHRFAIGFHRELRSKIK